MEDFIALFNQYVRSELLVIVPVLYVIANILSKSKIANTRIPMMLLTISVVLAGMYTFAVTPIHSFQTILMATFTTLIQGILLSGSAIFGGILKELAIAKKLFDQKSKEV